MCVCVWGGGGGGGGVGGTDNIFLTSPQEMLPNKHNNKCFHGQNRKIQAFSIEIESTHLGHSGYTKIFSVKCKYVPTYNFVLDQLVSADLTLHCL